MTPGATCRVCAAPLQPGALHCARCGAAAAAAGPCPHCGGTAGSSPDTELRYACDLCGGPRVPRLDPSLRSSGRDVPLLRKADAARKSRAAWRGMMIASAVALVLTVIPFTILLAVVGPNLILLFPGLLFTALFGSLLTVGATRAKSRGAEIAPSLDGAWLAAANDVAAQLPGRVTAEALARNLGIQDAQADELLALLDVERAVGGADLPDLPRPRLRIGAPTEPGAPPADALVQQQAEAEADAALEPERKKL